jgi:hypothetical protein
MEFEAEMAPAKRPATKTERLAIFRERLLAAPPARNLKDARALLEKVLNAVEDEYSGVPFNLENFSSDGRMYPPLDDRRKAISTNPRIERFESAGHFTLISENGATRIVLRFDGRVFVDKPGRDGRTIDQL